MELAGTEVGVRDECHDRFMGEIFHRVAGKTGDVKQGVFIGMTVDGGVGDEVDTALCLQYVHCGEMVVSGAYADYFLGYFRRSEVA